MLSSLEFYLLFLNIFAMILYIIYSAIVNNANLTLNKNMNIKPSINTIGNIPSENTLTANINIINPIAINNNVIIINTSKN